MLVQAHKCSIVLIAWSTESSSSMRMKHDEGMVHTGTFKMANNRGELYSMLLVVWHIHLPLRLLTHQR